MNKNQPKDKSINSTDSMMQQSETAVGGEQSKKAPVQPSTLREILYLLIKIGIIVVVTILIFTVLFGITRNASVSMDPAVKDGDLVIYYRLDKQYQQNDVIIVNYEGEKQIRRVIAVEGDVVSITKDGLMINGGLQQEEKIYTETTRFEEGIDFPVTVPKDCVFVLGDNREHATDSRIYGPVEEDATGGKVMTIIRRRGI